MFWKESRRSDHCQINCPTPLFSRHHANNPLSFLKKKKINKKNLIIFYKKWPVVGFFQLLSLPWTKLGHFRDLFWNKLSNLAFFHKHSNLTYLFKNGEKLNFTVFGSQRVIFQHTLPSFFQFVEKFFVRIESCRSRRHRDQLRKIGGHQSRVCHRHRQRHTGWFAAANFRHFLHHQKDFRCGFGAGLLQACDGRLWRRYSLRIDRRWVLLIHLGVSHLSLILWNGSGR